MREIFLDDSLQIAAHSVEQGKPPQISRRGFLRVAGLAGIGLALSSRDIAAQNNAAARWRDLVAGFVYTICSDSRANVITSQLNRASIHPAPRGTDFHFYYGAQLIFAGMTISPEEVICGNGFAVDQYPLYDVSCPCSGISDLNAFEIRRITNSKEIEYYGCVMVPVSRRTPVVSVDYANYLRTVRSYGLDPDKYKPEYKRVFRGKGHAFYGFQIADQTQIGANGKPLRDLLLSSEEIAKEKPRRNMILTSDDI